MAKGTALAKASVCWSNRNEATEAKTGKGEGEGGRDEVTWAAGCKGGFYRANSEDVSRNSHCECSLDGRGNKVKSVEAISVNLRGEVREGQYPGIQ